MQLKGLVRFFAILLIIYSLYQLSFTWFVRNHEKKMESRARAFVKTNYASALEKYPNNKDSQEIYQEILDKVYQERLRDLLDSTKNETVTYGINGAMSYKKAKEEELNLGLDLQGGLSVTLEVEMTGLLKALASNSKQKAFLAALDSADKRKANSSADFVSLFIDEYSKSKEPDKTTLAVLFTSGSNGKIDVTSSDAKVSDFIRSQAKETFERTFTSLNNRIDQFGVAQPNINKNPDKKIITVELPGIKDKERARKVLQTTANLQFWEVYTLESQNYFDAWQRMSAAFNEKYGGIKDTTAIVDSAALKADTLKGQPVAKKPADTITPKNGMADQLGNTNDTVAADTTGKTQPAVNAEAQITIEKLIQFNQPSRNEEGKIYYPSDIGRVAIADSGRFRKYLNEFRSFFPGDIVWAYGIPAKNKKGKEENAVPLYALKGGKPRLEGDPIAEAGVDYDQYGKVEVRMEMKNFAAKIWKKTTEDNVGKPIAIVLDNIVYSAPNVIGAIPDGTSSITGNYSVQEATDLANILKSGKLAAPAKIVQEQQVGATLGQEAIKGGTMAFLISFVVIFLLMLVYYNTSGWVANIALILNLLFTVGILAGLGATLTAPGIAGLVLTIGMAVDTNVIIYERIKEELSKGKGYIPAINEGYKRSLPPVLDAHVTTLLTAIILFYFGLGPVKGFATTQIIGILLSLFCGILVSRWITEWFTSKKKHLEYFTGVSKKIFKHAKFKFIEYRKYAYVVSMIVLGLGIAAYFNGFDQGVEFKGGRSYKINFKKKVNVEQVRKDLRNTFDGESPIIKTIGDNSTLDITTSYMITNSGQGVDSIVLTRLMTGLKNHLPPNISYEKFDKEFKQESKTVLPSISDDLLNGAKKATVFAIIIIFLYIFVRFRDWRYSLGTVVALLHDVLVTLAVFSFARTVVPFPLEIDQHFIAALLTVIGFSMNDTVIVFDRIREDSRLMPNAPRGEVINRAINETLSRTVMTSLTVFLTILILFLVGGETTKGFAFAMLIGVITGTYSSIFVAAPILVDLGGKRPLGRKAVLEKPKPGTTANKS